jgi:hypothetical protein
MDRFVIKKEKRSNGDVGTSRWNKMDKQFMSDYLICFVEKNMFSTITKNDVIDHFKKVKTEKRNCKI